jgi:hypothetical protein
MREQFTLGLTPTKSGIKVTTLQDAEQIQGDHSMANERALKHYAAMALEAAGLGANLEVYSTDHEDVRGELLYQGYHRDVAETKMMLEFRKTGYSVSFLIFNRATQKVDARCLTEAAKALRCE